MTNPKTHTCECGYTWKHGRSGEHSCGIYYRATIKDMKEVLDTLCHRHISNLNNENEFMTCKTEGNPIPRIWRTAKELAFKEIKY